MIKITFSNILKNLRTDSNIYFSSNTRYRAKELFSRTPLDQSLIKLYEGIALGTYSARNWEQVVKNMKEVVKESLAFIKINKSISRNMSN